MMYTTLKNTFKTDMLNVNFKGGINGTDSKSEADQNQYQFSKNLILNGTALESRKGLSPDETTVLGDYDLYGSMEKSMTVTDSNVYINGARGKICYNIWGDGFSYQDINIYFLPETGGLSSLGKISLNRIDEETFYRFKSILFFQGKKTCADGLYCFLDTLNQDSYPYEKAHRVFEYSFSDGSFDSVSNSDYYTPIIFMNGRGTRYDEAASLTEVYEGIPTYPEAQNLLGGKFMAFFTSDAYSADFDLPVSNLTSDSYITCKVYRNDSESCSWTIYPYNDSATASFFGSPIIFKCNRQTGHISFLSGTSPFPPPKTPRLKGNNIQITAVRQPDENEDRIIGSKDAVSFNSRIYLYGNTVRPNEVYGARWENPLYFPETMKTAVGNTASPVAKIKIADDRLLAVKDEGIFKISALAETKNESIEIPLGISREYKGPDTLKNTAVNTVRGSTIGNTVCLCDNILVFLSKDKNVYALFENGNISPVSSGISRILSDFTDLQIESAFASAHKGKYYLFIGNEVFVLDFKTEINGYRKEYSSYKEYKDNTAWSYLVLPETTKYLFSKDNTDGLIIFCSDLNGNYNYISSFGGETDRELVFSDGLCYNSEKEIEIELESQKYNFKSPLDKKEIKSIFFDMGGDGYYSISVNGALSETNQTVKLYDSSKAFVKILPFLPPLKDISFKITGKAPFLISSASFEYRLKG